MESPFGLIPTGLPPITIPTAAPSPTQFLYTIPQLPGRPFSHIVVFLLPGISLPPNTAAAVYIQTTGTANGFKFLGGIGPGKESAIFKIRGLGSNPGNGAAGEVDMDAPSPVDEAGAISLGISIESAESVSAQMAALQTPVKSQELVLAAKKPDTLMLAQRIIKNAFNFLASFSGNVNGGVEVVPLKAFEEWWKKFEGRVRNDPGFLERADGD
jgi:hypothetical protein